MNPVVLDTSGILHSDMNYSKGNFIVTNSVLRELLDEVAEISINSAINAGNITVRDPGDEFIVKVKEAAGKTGDLPELSQTDIDVLAIALEISAKLITDDYRIQNVAGYLSVKYEVSVQDGIRRRLRWKKICCGCGREYSLKDEICEVCGSELKKKAVRIN
ncbi:MAG: hypothetical protein KAU03_00620 [Candidatus Altiarchaeales archaeon]|nr:hypothetical protein [Candidatus Altiarchaeales archaeon]